MILLCRSDFFRCIHRLAFSFCPVRYIRVFQVCRQIHRYCTAVRYVNVIANHHPTESIGSSCRNDIADTAVRRKLSGYMQITAIVKRQGVAPIFMAIVSPAVTDNKCHIFSLFVIPSECKDLHSRNCVTSRCVRMLSPCYSMIPLSV